MAWTIYKSTDASAPVLSGTAGALITVLDAILVNGYGAKPAAGWTKEFTGTNKAAYRNGVGAMARKYIRIDDSGSVPTAAAKEAFIRGYDAMSNVDTGTTPFPTDLQLTTNSGNMIVRKSSTADATARAWVAAGDDRTFMFFASTGDFAGTYYAVYAGEYYSNLPGDAHAFALIAREVSNSGIIGAEMFAHVGFMGLAGIASNQGLTSNLVTNHYLGGSLLGSASSVRFAKLAPSFCYVEPTGSAASNAFNVAGPFLFPNPTDGAVYLSEPLMITYESGYCIRGHLRGLWFWAHPYTSANDGDTLNGSGPLAGKSWMAVKLVCAAADDVGTGSVYSQGVVWIETTTPAVHS
jgi:hypothetical protein